MREIKFRGREINSRKWVYGYLIKTKEGRSFIINLIPHEVIPETIGEITGWKDKNNKYIYEGDIIKAKAENVVHPQDLIKIEEKYLTSTVYWDNTYACFETDFNGFYPPESHKTCEIIGDIYEKK